MRTAPLYIGIDAGVSGGIATLYEDSAHVEAMPETETDLWYLIKSIALSHAHSPKYVMIEQVSGYVGGPGNTGSSQFKFGTNYGLCRMACIASGLRMEQVAPAVWQKGVGVPPRTGKGKDREGHREYKNRLKGRAQQLFPNVDGITLKTCDALLLAEYGRRRREGQL